MNVFKRFANIVSANVNSALDKMEDPKKMINLMIDQMEETAIEARASLAEKTATLTTLSRQVKETEEAIGRWADRARLAVEKDNDALAREAIMEKRKLEEQLKGLKESMSMMDGIIVSLKDQLGEIEAKLGEMKAKRNDLANRAAAAKEKMRNNETLKSADGDDFARRFEELQARIERWEAEANIACGGSKASKSTRETFEEMEADKAVEDELAALKAAAGKTEAK